MKVLVLGAAGMLGHQLVRRLSSAMDVFGTIRRPADSLAKWKLLPPDRLISGVDTENFDRIAQVIGEVRPDVVINCIGVIKQLDTAKDPISAISVNSLFPHRLSRLSAKHGARVVHFSTDCVFSGRKGSYKESDLPDATDLYGRTKLLGELEQEHCLTMRTSIIGQELGTRNGLVEWFLQNRDAEVKGFRRATFSGFTTLELARIVEAALVANRQLSGVYHVSSEPINKYDLLTQIGHAYSVSKRIVAVDEPQIDRSLDSAKFREASNYRPPSWTDMIRELAADKRFYERAGLHKSE